MEHSSSLERVLRGVLIALILIFFLFPIFWIFLMSFQTNEQVLRMLTRIGSVAEIPDFLAGVKQG